MSTLNFYKKNASYYYVIDDNDKGDATWWELEEEDIISSLEEIGYEDIRNQNKWDNDDGKIIARKQIELNFITAFIDVISRAGYYSGGNLDWSYWFRDEEGNIIEIGEDYDNSFYNYLDDDDKEFSKEIKKEQKQIKKMVEKEITLLEDKLSKITTPYVLEAVFSNGEGLYHRLDGRDLIKESNKRSKLEELQRIEELKK